MKAIDILKKAEEIENNWIVIEKETKENYGIAVRLTGDPQIQIVYFERKNGKINPDTKISIDVEKVEYLITAIRKLKDMEL